MHKKAAEELLEEKLKSETILASIGDAISIQDRNFTVLYQNQAHMNLTGDQKGKLCYEAYSRSRSVCKGCPIAKCFNDGNAHTIEKQGAINEGSIYVEISASPLKDNAGNIVAGIEIVRNITSRRSAEDQIRKLSLALEQSPLAIFISNTGGVIEYANPVFAQIAGHGIEKAVGKNIIEALSGIGAPNAYRNLIETVAGGNIWRKELFKDKDNEFYWYLATVSTMKDQDGIATHFIGFIEDITEQKKLEANLTQAQKIDAVGRLAGGIAHDFNNMLTAIIGYSSLLKENAGENPILTKYIAHVMGAAEKASNLTKSLLAFSKKQIINPVPLNLNKVVKDVEYLLLRLIGEDIELKTSLSNTDLIITADEGQISQVLLNLATNARDAMPAGGQLLIETAEINISENLARRYLELEPGRYALFTVTDTGIGISEKDREQIFEPFFTTKETGRGTGLGLSIVYGIVKQHNGHIFVYSELYKGTVVKIYLPLTHNMAIAEPLIPDVKAAGGTETILIGEDNADARELIKDILIASGYTVIEAVNGDDVLEKFNKHKDKVNLVLLDVIMPNMSGKEVLDKINETGHGVNALFMSGYTADIIHQRGILDKSLNFIAKPIMPNDLLEKVRNILDNSRGIQPK